MNSALILAYLGVALMVGVSGLASAVATARSLPYQQPSQSRVLRQPRAIAQGMPRTLDGIPRRYIFSFA